MSLRQLLTRAFAYHWRLHIGVGLGIALGTAILLGALVIGDSVRLSLKRVAAERLGLVTHAIPTGDRFFGADLATRLGRELPEGAMTAAILQVEGVAIKPETGARENRVSVLGVTDEFWGFAGGRPKGEVLINRKLATRLRVGAGDAVILRLSRPSFLSKSAALTPSDELTVSMRVTIDGVIGSSQLGNFSLTSNQLSPANVFIPYARLAKELEREELANLLLLGLSEVGDVDVNSALLNQLELTDVQLEAKRLARQGMIELRTPEVFIRDSVVNAVKDAEPEAKQIFTYLVNSIGRNDRQTPYSMVAAIEGTGLEVDEIILNRWCADDLGAVIKDKVKLTYWVSGQGDRLVEKSRYFQVKKIVYNEDPMIDGEMMPPFPGLHDAENCREWDSGLPIDMTTIRDKDETYWDEFRGLPKAVVTLEAGQQMWESRYGSATAMRLPMSVGLEGRLRDAILTRITPGGLGLQVVPVAEQAELAYTQSIDFSGLFIGFSFFLIAAAVILTGLVSSFAVRRRWREIGILCAVGFRRRIIYLVLLVEAVLVALPALVVGVVLGIVYARVMLGNLQSVWQGAIGEWPVSLQVRAGTVIVGLLLSLTLLLGVVMLTLWRSRRHTLVALLQGAQDVDVAASAGGARWLGYIKYLGVAGALVLLVMGLGVSPDQRAMVFFGFGGCLLVTGLLACRDLLVRFEGWHDMRHYGLLQLGLRNLCRRRGRSLAIVSMLACGTFLVIALETQRIQVLEQPGDVHSPSGDFDLLAETTHPLYERLDTVRGRERLDLELPEDSEMEMLAFRVLEGDDVSCLNLNRAQRPMLVAVDTQAIATRDPFSFMKHLPVEPNKSPWTLLSAPAAADEIPAIGDFNSITYTLGKTIGDTIELTDEAGQPIKLRLVGALSNPVLRSGLIVDEQLFARRFPSHSGHRLYLIDGPPEKVEAISLALEEQLGDYGMDVAPVGEVLAEYNRVQNTYISIFQVLGLLGMILGSLGLGLLVVNHVMERRRELALLRALGFGSGAVLRLVMGEHLVLYLAGITCGGVTALLAVLPLMFRPGAEAMIGSTLLTVVILLASGTLWTGLAALLATRLNLLPALRRE